MPIKPYIAQPVTLTDEQSLEALNQTYQNLILIRRDITTKPKPTYNIDGQEFKWSEYLDYLNKAIAALSTELLDANGPFEEETQLYT